MATATVPQHDTTSERTSHQLSRTEKASGATQSAAQAVLNNYDLLEQIMRLLPSIGHDNMCEVRTIARTKRVSRIWPDILESPTMRKTRCMPPVELLPGDFVPDEPENEYEDQDKEQIEKDISRGPETPHYFHYIHAVNPFLGEVYQNNERWDLCDTATFDISCLSLESEGVIGAQYITEPPISVLCLRLDNSATGACSIRVRTGITVEELVHARDHLLDSEARAAHGKDHVLAPGCRVAHDEAARKVVIFIKNYQKYVTAGYARRGADTVSEWGDVTLVGNRPRLRWEDGS